MSVDMLAALVKRLEAASADEITPAERLVLFVLAEDCRQGSRVTSPGLAEVAARTGFGERYVQRVTAGLCDEDRMGGPLLRRLRGGHNGRTTEYLIFPDAAPDPAKDGPQTVLHESSRTTKGRTPDRPSRNPRTRTRARA